ncbi:MAG: oligopeptide:H+ symporter [Legionellales bacterium]|nr:oligopeptide:H+ symporter [Legionellales bacterium]
MANHATKQPVGLWYLSVSFAILSFGFGILLSLLVLYLTERFGFSDKAAYALFAMFNTCLYIMPLYTGRIVDWFGYQRSYLVGVSFIIIAFFLMGCRSESIIYWGLALFIMGASFNSTAFLVLQGKLYAKDDIRRQSAFTLSYMIMNLSYLLSSITGGYIQHQYGYSWAFLISGGVAIGAIIVFCLGIKTLTPHPSRQVQAVLNWRPAKLLAGLLIMALWPVGICYFALRHATSSTNFILVLGAIVIVGILAVAFTQPQRVNRYRILAFILLSLVSIGFWSLYMLEPSLLTVFIKNHVDRIVHGHTIPPSVFYGLNPFYIITVGWLLSYLWIYLHKHNRDMSIPAKFTASLIIMSSGFLLLVVAIGFANAVGKIHIVWILLCYLFFTVGELFIAPIGNAMVGSLAPEGLEGFLMGVWQFFIGFSATVSAYLAKLATTQPESGVQSLTVYHQAFLKIGLFGAVIALVSLLLLPLIKKIMMNVKQHQDTVMGH